MKLEVTLRAGRVERVMNNNEEMKFFTHIIDKYVEEKGFKIINDGDEDYYISLNKESVKLFLSNYTTYYNNNETDDIINRPFESFKENLFDLIEEVREKMKELKREEKIILEIE